MKVIRFNTSLIIEGPDGMGKSTLAQQLAKELKMKTQQCGPAPASLLEMVRWLNKQERLVRKGRTVLDRATCISSQVYTQAYGRKIDLAVQIMLDREVKIFEKLGATFILCVTETPCHEKKEYDTLEGMQSIKEITPFVAKLYRRFFTDAHIDVIIYDWTKENAFSLLTQEIWRRRNERQRILEALQ